MVSPHRLSEKERREFRRKNHIAKDLLTPKYRQRVIKNKKRQAQAVDSAYKKEHTFDGRLYYDEY